MRMAYTGGHPSMPPPVSLPVQPGGRAGQMVGQPAIIRKHRHDDEEQGKLFVGGLRYETILVTHNHGQF